MRAGDRDDKIEGSEDIEANLKFRISQTLGCSAILKKSRELQDENKTQAERNRKLAPKIEAKARCYEILGSAEIFLKQKRDMIRLGVTWRYRAGLSMNSLRNLFGPLWEK